MTLDNRRLTSLTTAFLILFSLYLSACGGISSTRSSTQRTPGEPKETRFLTLIIKDAEIANQIRVASNNGESEFFWTEKRLTKKQDISLSSTVSEPRIWCNILFSSGFPLTKDQTFSKILWGRVTPSNSREENAFPYVVFLGRGQPTIELRCYYKGDTPNEQEILNFLSPIVEIRKPQNK